MLKADPAGGWEKTLVGRCANAGGIPWWEGGRRPCWEGGTLRTLVGGCAYAESRPCWGVGEDPGGKVC